MLTVNIGAHSSLLLNLQFDKLRFFAEKNGKKIYEFFLKLIFRETFAENSQRPRKTIELSAEISQPANNIECSWKFEEFRLAPVNL
jgi:hypothetical protein